jgi:transcriptional regulator with PAS, ATPase and Fis domain
MRIVTRTRDAGEQQRVASDMVVANAQMRELCEYAKRVAATDAKVLLTGESGVGKDVIARLIHANSPRRGRMYVAVNCAGVAESLLESELFGHVKGSFTGAYRDKVGKLQVAHGGTLFLDELGEMSPRMQGLLLRFLENGEIQAVGSDTPSTTVNVRVIAATNRNLLEQVATGQFREDLFYRLRVIHLHVPPLRERPEDVRLLAAHFLGKSGRQITLTNDAWAALERYPWRGNVRELQNVMEQITALATSPDMPIDVTQLPLPVTTAPQTVRPARERRRQLADELYQAVVEGGYSFWEHIHPMFLRRDITRHDIREMVRRGLSVTRGNYRGLLDLFRIPSSDYKRFVNFLATHDCRPDFREFRNPTQPFAGRPLELFPGLPRVHTLQHTDAAISAAAGRNKAAS